MSTEIFDSPYVTMRIEDSIISGIYKKGITIDLEDARKIAQDRITFLNGRIYPAFVDLRSVRFVTKEARNYFAQNAGIKGLKALAILVGNRLTVFIANFYLKLDKPKVPTKVFRTKEQAMNWLEQFVHCSVSAE